MVFRLLWRVVRCAVMFEFCEVWLTLLVLWIHIRYPHQAVIAGDQGEDEADDQD